MAYSAGASSGNLVLLSSQTASSSASLEFTNLTGYDIFFMQYYNVFLSSASANLTAYLSENNGSSYDTNSSNYIVNGYYSIGAGLTNVNIYPSDGLYIVDYNNTTGGNPPFCGNTTFYHFGISGAYSSYINNFVGYFYNSLNWASGQFGGQYLNTGVVNAMQLFPSSGNITSGTFKLYGVQN